MLKFDEINLYKNKLDLNEVKAQINLHEIDEAINVCDLSILIKKYKMWKKLLPQITPYYAVKCNNDPYILQVLAELGIGFDCASKNEIEQILEMGVHPNRIIFAQPCKPLSHLKYSMENDIYVATVDNEFEIYKMFREFPKQNLVIRFRSDAENAQCPLGEKFGCDIKRSATSLMLLAKSLQLNVTGTSFHVGSGCKDFIAYDRAISSAKNLFDFGTILNFNLHLLDIGGGFPGSDDDKFKNLSDIINSSLDKNFSNREVDIIAEPGRFFVAEANTIICKIHAKREVFVAGKLNTIMYYVNDGVYGSFNCILYDHQTLTVKSLKHNNEENLHTFNTIIWGPTCDALDKIIEDIYLPNLCCGDYIIIPNMGAYTTPIASPFNGFTIPRMLYFKQDNDS